VTRNLLCTRRVVPLDLLDDYLARWRDVTRAAQAAGARAWLFRRTGHDDHFQEFLEWESGAVGAVSVADEPALAGARAALAELAGAGDDSEWEEAGA
jgi:hypothetical protein